MSFSQMGFSDLRFTIQIWIEILLQITCRTKEIKKGYVYVYFNIKWLKITKNGGSLRLLWIDILLRALLCNFLLAMMRCLISPLKQGWDLCWSLKDIIGTCWPRQLRRMIIKLVHLHIHSHWKVHNVPRNIVIKRLSVRISLGTTSNYRGR